MNVFLSIMYHCDLKLQENIETVKRVYASGAEKRKKQKQSLQVAEKQNNALHKFLVPVVESSDASNLAGGTCSVSNDISIK